jgi:hypothetical protein
MIRVCVACNRQFVARRAHGLTCSKACSAERKREYDRKCRDGRVPPGHKFKDVGPALPSPDWKPRAVRKNPEEAWAKAFGKMGRTYAAAPIASGDAIDELARKLVGAER